MKYENFLNEMGASLQKLAFITVKEILAMGLKKADISILQKDKKLRVKMPDRPAGPTQTSQKGLEFVVDVLGENKILINNKEKDINEFINEVLGPK